MNNKKLNLYVLGAPRCGSTLLWDVFREIEIDSKAFRIVNKTKVTNIKDRKYFKDDYQSYWKDMPYSYVRKTDSTRIVCIIRDLRDSLCSLYLHLFDNYDSDLFKLFKNMNTESAFDYLIHSDLGIKRVIRFFNDYYNKPNVVFFRFEHFIDNIYSKVTKYIESLGIKIDDNLYSAIYSASLHNSYIERVKEKTANMGDGEIGKFKKYLSPRQSDYIKTTYKDFYDKFRTIK